MGVVEEEDRGETSWLTSSVSYWADLDIINGVKDWMIPS